MFVAASTTDAAFYARVNGVASDPYAAEDREYFERLGSRAVQGFGGVACVSPSPAPRPPALRRVHHRRRYRVQSRR